MDAAALNHLRVELRTAERTLREASDACRQALAQAEHYQTSWVQVASYATQAAAAAQAVSTLHDILVIEGAL